MQVSTEFYQAIKKYLKYARAIVVSQSNEDEATSNLMICLEIPQNAGFHSPKDNKYVSTPTKITVENNSRSMYHYKDGKSNKITRISFHCDIYYYGSTCYVTTFLRAIKPNSDVKFFIHAYNNSENDTKAGLVSHQLIGNVDGAAYLLSDSTTPDVVGSTPVQGYMVQDSDLAAI